MSTTFDNAKSIAGPGQIGLRGWLRIVRSVHLESVQHDMTTTAAAISFLVIFGVLSSISAFVAFYGLFTSTKAITSSWQSLSGFVPADTLLTLIGQMNGVASQPHATLLSAGIFSLGMAIWCAQQGMSTLMRALNRAYYLTPKHTPLMHLIKSLWIAVEVVLGLLFTAFLAIGVPKIASNFSKASWWPEITRDGGLIIGGLVLFAGLIALYRWVPDRKPPRWRWIRPGAVLVVGFWTVASSLFSIFLGYWNSYTAMYGSLSAMLIFLTLTYVATISVLLGAELNAQVERYIPPE